MLEEEACDLDEGVLEVWLHELILINASVPKRNNI